jgi:hypothetical protein
MLITIRFMPDAQGVRPSDLVIGDLCSYHISSAG